MGPAVLVIAVIGFIVLSFVFARVLGKRLVGGSKEDQETIRQLMATGARARATVAGATPTGVTVNNHHVGIKVDFWLEPLDGSPQFRASKKMYLFQTQFPRTGDVWPSWYDRQDPSRFAVAAPLELNPEQIEIYREFGIDHPLDSSRGG